MTPINRDWIARLHAPRYIWSQIAAHAPTRGIICREEKSLQTLLAWDVTTGETRPLTEAMPYPLNATLSPDGEFVTYLRTHPNHPEVFQYVRVPYAGGDAQPIAPTALIYASPHLEETAGERIGFTAVTDKGYVVQVWTPTSPKPLFSFESEVFAHGPFLSADGRLAVVVTMHSADSEYTHLEAYDIETGVKISQLEIPDTPLEAVKFAPDTGDSRLVWCRHGQALRTTPRGVGCGEGEITQKLFILPFKKIGRLDGIGLMTINFCCAFLTEKEFVSVFTVFPKILQYLSLSFVKYIMGQNIPHWFIHLQITSFFIRKTTMDISLMSKPRWKYLVKSKSHNLFFQDSISKKFLFL
ncbi:hypothetical protein HC776_03575 [bacterium]|nr:hypothetical protein [bacterium]